MRGRHAQGARPGRRMVGVPVTAEGERHDQQGDEGENPRHPSEPSAEPRHWNGSRVPTRSPAVNPAPVDRPRARR